MKIIILLLVILVSCPAFAEYGARLEVGKAVEYAFGDRRAEREKDWYRNESTWKYGYTDVHLFWRFGFIGLEHELYGGYRTWMIQNGTSFSPFRDIYTIGYKLHVNRFYIKAEHFCNHAVYSGEDNGAWYDNRWGEDITTVSLGVEISCD